MAHGFETGRRLSQRAPGVLLQDYMQRKGIGGARGPVPPVPPPFPNRIRKESSPVGKRARRLPSSRAGPCLGEPQTQTSLRTQSTLRSPQSVVPRPPPAHGTPAVGVRDPAAHGAALDVRDGRVPVHQPQPRPGVSLSPATRSVSVRRVGLGF